MTDSPRQPEFGAAYASYQINRGALRKLVRSIFLRRAAALCKGRVLDFGCGAGELLRLLPAGSRGLEVNPHAIRYCHQNGLDVDLYDPAADEYHLDMISPGAFQTLIASHVLEHLPEAHQVLHALLAACQARGIGRLVMIVPGSSGFASDSTHRTFITADYLRAHGFFDMPHARLARLDYFPLNMRWIGNHLRYHEMTAVFEIA